ncbi:MAG: hypothetical protein ACREON_17965 [Gemmatimonadaceae bacterium]
MAQHTRDGVMTASQPGDTGENLERFDYYMLRLTRSDEAPDRVAGMVERLGTGEKRSFDTPEQLLRLVRSWSAPEPNMQAGER